MRYDKCLAFESVAKISWQSRKVSRKRCERDLRIMRTNEGEEEDLVEVEKFISRLRKSAAAAVT